MRLPIITAPDAFLKQRSQPVSAVTDDVRELIAAMFDTMYAANGIGLAAVQVGVLLKVIVVDLGEREGAATGQPTKLALINAEVVEESEEPSWYNEGCLSFPSQYAEVERPARVTIRYLDEQGVERTIVAEGLLATCLQHEIDHTNGVTFVDHISSMKRDIILRKLKKAKKLDHHHDHDHVHGEHCNH